MMKALLLCHQGIEQFASFEAERHCKAVKIVHYKGGIVFEVERIEDLFKLCYLGQSPTKILLLLGDFLCPKPSLSFFCSSVSTLDFSPWLSPRHTLAVRTDITAPETTSREIEAELGSVIISKTGCAVNLSKPDVTLAATLLSGRFFVGINISCDDLAKRDYRIFFGRETLKAPIAAYAFWTTGILDGQNILDPFCREGTIVIEGAHLLTHRSVHYFHKDKFFYSRMPHFRHLAFPSLFEQWDAQQLPIIPSTIYCSDKQFQHVASTKKNAKIAAVEKLIHFSRTDVNWLDVKFKPGELDHVLSHLPHIQAGPGNEKETAKELFLQSHQLLSPKGKITIITKNPSLIEDIAQQHHFINMIAQPVLQGGETFFILKFTR